MGTLLILILFLITLLLLLSTVFNKYLPIWVCKKLGWHLCPNEIGPDGCSFRGICPRCGKKILQDSKGNWF